MTLQLFEGMKAYRGEDGKLRMFRPDRNMARMIATSKRSSLPSFDAGEMIKCMKRLIQIDKSWIPHSTTSSLYIRPTFIATDVSFVYIYFPLLVFETELFLAIFGSCQSK